MGFKTELKAINPLNNKHEVPVYFANFVLMDYGFGAVFGCPAHDQRDLDFALKYNLDVKPVVKPESSTNNFKEFNSYFDIPENNDCYRDLLHKFLNKPNEAFQYEEILENSDIKFIPKRVNINISSHFFHKEIDFVS